MVQGKQIKDGSIRLVKVNPVSGQMLTLLGTSKIQQNQAPTVGIDLVNKDYVDSLVVSASAFTATNGLTRTLLDVQLGGLLLHDTEINGDNLYELNIEDVTKFEVVSQFEINLATGGSIYNFAGNNINNTTVGDIVNSIGNAMTNTATLGNITHNTPNGNINNTAGGGSINNIAAADIVSTADGIISNTAVGDVSIVSSLGKIMNLAYDDVVISSTDGMVTVTGSTRVSVKATTGTNWASLDMYTTGQAVTNNGTNNMMVVKDSLSSKGIVYSADYSANFTPESLVSKRYADAVSAATGGNLTQSNKSMAASVTTAAGQQLAAAIAAVPKNDSYVQVFINGLKCTVGDGTNTKAVYFAAPGTLAVPKAISAITSGDVLVRGTALGYNTDATDTIEYDYQA